MAAPWPPTGLTLRGWSAYLLAQFPLTDLPPECGGPATQPPLPTGGGYHPIDEPEGYGGECDPMKPTIDAALPLLSALTCRNFTTGEDIPDHLAPTATLATTLFVEQMTYGTGGEQRESAMSSATGNLRSISAGPWSESYFAPGEVEFAWNVLNPDPLLNSMLLALITPECLAIRQGAAEGEYPPGYATQEIDWGYPADYGYAGRRTNFPETGGDWLP